MATKLPQPQQVVTEFRANPERPRLHLASCVVSVATKGHQKTPRKSRRRTPEAEIPETQEKHKVRQEVQAQLKERQQKLSRLQNRQDDLAKEIEKVKEAFLSDPMFLMDQDAEEATQRATREMRAVVKKEAELRSLQEEYATLKVRKQQLIGRVEKESLYEDFMLRLAKVAKDEDLASLTNHLDITLHIKNELWVKDTKAQKRIHQHKQTLLNSQGRHDLLMLQLRNQLRELDIELAKWEKEIAIWSPKFEHVHKTSKDKKLRLILTMMAAFNLYESIGGEVGKECRAEDTEAQLNRIMVFTMDNDDIVKEYELRERMRIRKSNEHKAHANQILPM